MSIISNVLKNFLNELGISENMVEKGKSLMNSVDVEKKDNKTIITLRVDKITIILEDE